MVVHVVTAIPMAARLSLYALLAAVIALASTAHPHRALATTTGSGTCSTADQAGVVFIIDDSGSMTTNDPNRMAAESVAAAVDAIRPGTYLAVSKFSTNASQLVAPTLVSDTNRDSVVSSVRTGLVRSGLTMFDRAFTEAKRQLDAMPSSVTTKTVIFMSDGSPTDPGFTADRSLGVPIHTYSFGAYANDTVLQNIATRSSATFTKVTKPADLMPAFLSLVTTMACDEALQSSTNTLRPGMKVSIPFTIGADVNEYIGSATWDDSQITTTIRRPDNSIMAVTGASTSTLRDGERFTPQQWYAMFGAVKPMTGRWIVEFTNVSSKDSNVSVRISRRTTPLALDCKTFTATSSGRSIALNWTRSLDPRVTYTIDYRIGGTPGILTGITNPSATLTDGVDFGLAFSATISARIRKIRVGLGCTRTLNLGAIPVTNGTPGDDVLTGVDFRDVVYGFAGNDTITTLALPDRAFGGDGSDTIDAGDGRDLLFGDNGSDTLIGGSGDDTLDGGSRDAGADNLDGGLGADRIYGFAGTDTIDGGPGRDSLFGGDGNDVIDADDDVVSRDFISCGSGNDTVTANLDKNKRRLDTVGSDCEHVTWIEPPATS